MPSTTAIYPSAVQSILSGAMDLENDAFRIVLLTGHTVDQVNHSTYADISANEVTGTGYTAGGLPLALTVARTGLETEAQAPNVTWDPVSITAGFAAVVHDANADGALASTDQLLTIVDLAPGAEITTTNGPFVVQFTDGVLLSVPVPAYAAAT